MIAKGNQRSGGAQLATHLLNAHDNERVEVLEVRGSIANDLHGAFTEWQAQSKATGCTQYLYSLSVNPDQKQGHLTRDQYLDFLTRVEQRLGLQSQGRAVVFHWKRDKSGAAREHCHAVWSRIDPQSGRAVNLPHDRMKLRSIAQEFALEHERRLPPGMREERGPARHQERASHASLQEKQQEERTGIAKDERRATLTDAWQRSLDGPGFVKAVQRSGYILARGDARAYVVIDRGGEVHSLGRQIDGVKSAAIRARLELSHPVGALPSVEIARNQARQQQQGLQEIERQRQPQDAAVPRREERHTAMIARQAERRADLTAKADTLKARHIEERSALAMLHEEQRAGSAERRAWPSRGMVAFLQRITGIRALTTQFQDRKLGALQQRQEKALNRRHQAEEREIERQGRSLDAVDRREQRSFDTHAKREGFQKLEQRMKADERIVTRIEDRRAQIGPQHEQKLTTAQRREALRQTFTERRMPDAKPLSNVERRPSLTANPTALPGRFSQAAKNETPETARLTDAQIRPDAAEQEAERQREIERRRQLQERLER